MRGNLNRMFENQNDLEAMEEKSDKIRNSAESFQVSATRLEKIARHRRYRAYLIIFAMLLSFCLLMYLIFRSPAPTTAGSIGPEAALSEAPLIGDSASNSNAHITKSTSQASKTVHKTTTHSTSTSTASGSSTATHSAKATP